jgi:hypothetical protein
MKTNKRLMIILLSVMGLLCIPLIAMQFTTEVRWDLKDFITAGILLAGTGSLVDLVLRKVKRPGYRLALCGGLLISLFLVWAELAVGVFGSPWAGS